MINFTLILQLLGSLLFFALQFSCILIALNILHVKSVKKLSSLTFVSLFVNGVYWAEYGIFKEDYAIWIPNFISIFVALFCMACYYKYSIVKPIEMYLISCFLTAISFILVIYKEEQFIGIMACILSISVSGSPLAVIKTVIYEKSTASLPFLTSFISWLNCIIWVIYGYYIIYDVIILVPNLCGLCLTSIQMCLFIIYGFNKEQNTEKIIDASKKFLDL